MSPEDHPLALAERIYQARGADLLRYLRQRLRNDADVLPASQQVVLTERGRGSNFQTGPCGKLIIAGIMICLIQW